MKPKSCEACPLWRVGAGFVRGDGVLPARILIVGEAPGETEAADGKPFVGSAGKMLDRLLEAAGIDRASSRVANTICCRPPKNFLVGAPYETRAIAHCHPFLEEEILQTKPKVIIALGNTAFRRLTGLSGISRYRGFPVWHPSGAWVVGTYHPSFLLPRKGQKESAKLTGLVVMDLLRAKEIAEKGFALSSTENYLLDPRPMEAQVWAARAEAEILSGRQKFLSVDIETPGKMRFGSVEEDFDLTEEGEGESGEYWSVQILRVSYSFAPGESMSIPWSLEYMGVHRRLLQLPEAEYVFWNGYAFDLPILQINGVEVKGKAIHDGMWAWHMLQSDLPRGLEAVASVYAPEIGPWKHLSSGKPALYNAIDADAALRNFLGIEKDLKENHQWEIYLRHVVELYPILFKAGRIHGVGIDRFAQNALRKELEEARDRLFREAQKAAPAEIRGKVFSTEAGARKKGPGEVVEVEGAALIRRCTWCGKEKPKKDHLLLECPEGRIEMVPVPKKQWKWIPDWEALSGNALLKAVNEAGFNPVSTKQLQAYARKRGHRLGVDYKTQKEQLNKRTRRDLIKRHGAAHPIYPIAQELQDITKTLGTYVVGFEPDAKGKIYTTYSFSPSTGRLASANKNLQNVTHNAGNRYAAAIRRTILPPLPGCVFVEVDSSAIEAVLTGWFMQDDEYVRLARQGIHDYVTCLELGLEFDPKKLGEYKKDPAYVAVRERNKRVVHGTSYGMSPKMMVMVYGEIFRTEREAAFAQGRFLEAVPRLGAWQHEVRVTAHKQRFLTNPWGYRHYFYQVFTKNAQGQVVNGPDAKRVVAFLPQSSAGAIMRDTLLILKDSEWAEYAPANLSIHDSVALAVPRKDAERAVEWLTSVMSRPIPELGGLRIGCEAKIGENWADMRVVKKVDIE